MKKSAFFILCSALALGACGDDDVPTPPDDAGVDQDTMTMDDAGPDPDAGPPNDAGPPPDPTCANLCAAALDSCAGEAAAYANMTECMSWCEDIGRWEAGTAGDSTGNTIACRITAIGAGNCAAGGFTGGDVCGSWCENYCNNLENTCEGSDAQYDNQAECMAECANFDTGGVAGTTSGDSIQCRIYHGGIPADMMPETHCDHAGPTGLDSSGAPVCAFNNMGFDFRMDAADAYTRIDRLGMPAVSTALAMNKSAYNDGDPSDDAALTFAGELIGSLNAVHDALDDDIADTAGITACSMDPSDPMDPASLPGCLAQPVVAGGPAVVSLVVPDTLTLDTSAASGFPNGRQLTDPVIDVTLAVILLDMTINGPTDLVGVLNPDANDVAFRTEFPYLAPAQ